MQLARGLADRQRAARGGVVEVEEARQAVGFPERLADAAGDYGQIVGGIADPGAFTINDENPTRAEEIPDEVRGISRVRNWILQRFEETAIVMADDDIKSCISLVALRRKFLLPGEIMAMLENTAYCAAGAGAGIFGWHQRADPRLLARNNPIATTHWVGGVLGVVGREPRWDELLTCKCDIDACRREFMERRIVWQDSRFCFEQERDTNLGGNSLVRTEERIKAERRYLISKWKAHIQFEEYKSQDRVSIRVDRKQALSLP